ncbi:hypothetical protein PAHAL_4G106300 [Panicum hallii]|jgi:hypothetical protein|uniref:DUF4228 domain-containing protein n=1 Tax=Panicum hallii TaxID=206008 RepID=A0A2S3HIJ3_9POAL|nr:hypothetical protein PAHAL_4G106300 [Panicum hallii]
MASWFSCTRSAARGQHVKLVFPGGHVELLDRPTPAADVMARHPRFCVARPDVFREPAGAVAAPDAVLQLGHKYYVVPCSTVRRLQKHSATSSARGAAAGGRRSGSGGAVTLKRHLASERGYKVGGRRWLRCLVGGGAQAQLQPSSQRPRERESVGHSGKADTVRKVDMRETNKENGKAPGVGSPGRRRRRGVSPGNSASYSWQPSLHSITEE